MVIIALEDLNACCKALESCWINQDSKVLQSKNKACVQSCRRVRSQKVFSVYTAKQASNVNRVGGLTRYANVIYMSHTITQCYLTGFSRSCVAMHDKQDNSDC